MYVAQSSIISTHIRTLSSRYETIKGTESHAFLQAKSLSSKKAITGMMVCTLGKVCCTIALVCVISTTVKGTSMQSVESNIIATILCHYRTPIGKAMTTLVLNSCPQSTGGTQRKRRQRWQRWRERHSRRERGERRERVHRTFGSTWASGTSGGERSARR